MKMKKHVILFRAMTAMGVIALAPGLNAVTNIWTGASSPDLNWITPGNWLPSGPPGTGDDAYFFNTGAAADTVTIDNTVTANTTIHALWLGQTNGIHNMFINPGVTLTVRGTNDNGYGPLGSGPEGSALNPNVQSTLYVGTKVYDTSTTVVSNTISGGGTLVLSNANNELNVRQTHSGGTGQRAVLDMSGLNTFAANLGRIRIGDGESEPIRRAQGYVFLAKTNTITLTGTNSAENVQLVIGNNDVNNNGNGGTSFLYLGQQNTINVDEILVGGRKTPGTIIFNSIFSSPTITLRGSDGVSRVRAFRIGDQSNQTASGNPTTGTVNLSAGTADIRADRVIIATSQKSAGSAGTGTLTLGAGTLDANSIELATQIASDVTVAVTGTLNVSNTIVTVNNSLQMGRSAGGTGVRTANLNINGGAVIVRSNYVTGGAVNITVTNGLLALLAKPSVLASNLFLDGGTISNAASLKVTNALTVANNGVITGNPIFDMGNSGTATWDFQGVSGGGLTVSNVFQGSGTYFGNLSLAPGATLSPGGNGAVGTLAVQISTTGGNITLNGGSARFDLSSSGLSGNDLVTASGTVTLSATNDVNLTSLGGAFDTVNPYTLLSAGTLVGNQNNLRIAGGLAQSRYTFTFDTTSTPNSVKLSVGGTGPSSLTWVGDGGANTWNLKSTANWNNGAPSQFFSLDAVTFSDSGSASPAVNLVGLLNPGSITMSNATKNYTFSGTGGLLSSALTKAGNGSLTFNNTGDLSFNGAVTIQSGTVSFSNTGSNTFGGGLTITGGGVTLGGASTCIFSPATGLAIGTGTSLTVANANANSFDDTTIQLDGSLTFNQPADAVLRAPLSGAGTLTKSGTNMLTLAAVNSGLTSVIQINAGTLKAGTSTALGAGATVASGAKLDLNAQNPGTTPITATGAGPSGEGAIVSTGGSQNGNVANVTLAGNTTFGGSGAWNTDPVQNVGLWSITASLNTGNQPYKLTKVGPNQVTLNNAVVDPALSDIDIQFGLLALQGGTDSLGNPTNTLSIRAGATVSFSTTTAAWDKKFVLFGNGVTPNFFNYNGANTVVGAIALNGNCVISAATPDRGAPVSLTLAGALSGSGGLTKPSQDMLIFSGANTYTGDTVVNLGTLALSGNGSISTSSNITLSAGATLDASLRTDGTFTLATNQTLRGNGAINGIFIASTGSTVSPGASIGSLSVTGAVTLRGTVLMELNAAAATNDVISSSTSIALNGAIISVTNVAGVLSNGATFKLFDAPAGQISGTFTIQPATPGPGQTWNSASLAVDGTLKVVGNASAGQPKIGGIQLTGGNVVFNGTGGTANGDYYVLTSTNVTTPLASWLRLVTNKFDGSGNFSFTNAVSPSTPQLFYRLQIP